MAGEDPGELEWKRRRERAREARKRQRKSERKRELDLPDKLRCPSCQKDRTWIDKRELRGPLTHVRVLCARCLETLWEMDIRSS